MIDIRSDTVTKPTEAMRKAMTEAEVGDDVYGDDPTVNELERLAAEMVGKEAALFVPSGTFGNQLALFTWCKRGSEVILGEDCHIIQHEAGAASVIAGVQTRPIPGPKGIMNLDDIEKRIRGNDIHYPSTSLICMENAHSAGTVVPLEHMKAVYQLAQKHRIPRHLDGARLFNAAAALQVPAKELAAQTDSVMFCLSKGLCAPIGSMLAGPAEFIARARRNRKIMGGGMRQAGILAAAGIVALRDMTGRLKEDHRRARRLAQGLGAIPGIQVATDRLDINMVFFSIPALASTEKAARFMGLLKEKGILANPPEQGNFRFVTHYWIGDAEVDTIIAACKRAMDQIQ
jgi:threonine aldolase